MYFCLSRAFVDLSALQYLVEFEATVLIDGGEDIEVQVSVSEARRERDLDGGSGRSV